jgi:hypothetical protein
MGGRPRDGYTKDDRGQVVPDPERAEVASEVLDMAREGKPDMAIAKSLNARRRRTRQGNQWTRRTVQDLVKGPSTRSSAEGRPRWAGPPFERRQLRRSSARLRGGRL